MTTLEKLERRIRECELTVKRSLSYDAYDFAAAEECDLLEEAASKIRSHEEWLASIGNYRIVHVSERCPELTDDEFAVLEISNAGNSMIAIGRWEKPIEHLVELGLMRSVNKANNYITDQGRVALERYEQHVDGRFKEAFLQAQANHPVAMMQPQPFKLQRRRESITVPEVVKWIKENHDQSDDDLPIVLINAALDALSK